MYPQVYIVTKFSHFLIGLVQAFNDSFFAQIPIKRFLFLAQRVEVWASFFEFSSISNALCTSSTTRCGPTTRCASPAQLVVILQTFSILSCTYTALCMVRKTWCRLVFFSNLTIFRPNSSYSIHIYLKTKKQAQRD